MAKYIIPGRKLEDSEIQKFKFSSLLIEKNKHKVELFEIDTTTRATGKLAESDISDNGMAYYEFEDGSFLFLTPEEVNKLALNENSIYPNRSESGDIKKLYLSVAFSTDNTRDGWFQKSIVKIVSFITGAVVDEFISQIGEYAAEKIAKKLELKTVANEGLYVVKHEGALELYEKKENPAPFFLYIHGTNSNTKNAFFDVSSSENEKISNQIIRDAISRTFSDNVLAFEHHTLTKSPLDNVLLLVEKLPKNIELAIMTHSRGGLIADTLLMCIDALRNNNFDRVDNYFKEENRNKESEIFTKIIDVLKTKNINVFQVIKVACPGNGTTLLSDNIINLLRVISETNKWLNMSVSGEIIELLEQLIVALIKSKDNPEILPGLEAMVPDNSFLDLLNTYKITNEPKCYLLAGQSSLSLNIIHSLKFFFSRMVIQDHSDMVVNTTSMLQGLPFRKALFNKVTGSRIHHSSYFYQQNTAELLEKAITKKGKFDSADIAENLTNTELERGIAFENGNYIVKQVSGLKPVTILIPGMMASSLKKGNDHLWIDYLGFPGGSLFEMEINEKLDVIGVIATAYESFCKYLISSGHDVYVIPYDWRLSYDSQLPAIVNGIEEVLKAAGNQPVRVVSHSKGGLLLRQLFLEKNNVFNHLSSRKDFRWIMLGTPWYGSYAAVKTIIGQSKTLRNLRILSGFVSTQRLLKVFSEYPGILEMLPMDITTNHNPSFDFSDIGVWKDIHNNDRKNKHKWLVPPLSFSDFKKIKDKVSKIEFSDIDTPGKLNKTNIYYIAGTHEKTPKSLHYNANEKTYYCEDAIFEGDSTVTWKEGFPKNMEEKNKFYVNTKHDRLLDDGSIFGSIFQLLETGKCNLSNSPSLQQTRSTNQTFVPPVYTTELIDSNLRLNNINQLFGKEDDITESSEQDMINVSVSHGDLKFASGPLIIGHFFGEYIAKAEYILDKAIGGHLSDRFKNKVYPGALGSSLFILREPHDKPVGALIIGLGNQFDLTGFLLSMTIKEGILNAYHQYRESGSFHHKPFPDSWSTLLIGTAYGNLSISTSVKSIITGVQMANNTLNDLHKSNGFYGNVIKHVEFIELFHDKAYSLYYVLRNFESDGLLRFESKGIISKPGGVHKLSVDYGNDRWNQMTIRARKKCPLNISNCKDNSTSLIFDLNVGISKEESKEIFINKSIIDKMLDDLIKEKERVKSWDKRISKVLFERLIPQDFKMNLRVQNNMVLNLDNKSASYPWELIQDTSVNDKPLCVTAGLIRQLNTNKCGAIKPYAEKNRILIIGDPVLDSKQYTQLPGAAAEARQVKDIFEEKNYETNDQIKKSDYEIIQSIYADQHRMIHIAAHGDFDPNDTFKSGIVIGCRKKQVKDGEGNIIEIEEPVFLTSSDIVQLDPIPEFVFINTCYSGKNTSEASDFSYRTYEFASNTGEQFIKEGVKAIIVAGWPVYDDSALYFAQTFYQEMFKGANFGQAVQRAREACYEYAPDKNTWGAYQCYGDPMYKFGIGSGKLSKKLNLEVEVLNEYESIINKAEMSKSIGSKLREELFEVDEALELQNIDKAHILEKQAMAHYKLGNNHKANEIFKRLFTHEKATFSLKSLEQIYNVQAKIAVEEANAVNAGNKIDFLTKIANRFEYFSSEIGETAERFSLIGSTYKRIAFLKKKFTKKDWKKNLNDAIKYYSQAKSKKNDENDFYNALVILQLNAVKGEIELPFFKQVVKNLEYYKLKDEYFDQTIWFNVYVTEYLLTSDCSYKVQKKKPISEFLIDEFEKAWEHYGAFHHLKGEYEHQENLIEFLPSNDQRRMEIQKVTEYIRNIESSHKNYS